MNAAEFTQKATKRAIEAEVAKARDRNRHAATFDSILRDLIGDAWTQDFRPHSCWHFDDDKYGSCHYGTREELYSNPWWVIVCHDDYEPFNIEINKGLVMFAAWHGEPEASARVNEKDKVMVAFCLGDFLNSIMRMAAPDVENKQ